MCKHFVLVLIQFVHHFVDSYVSPEELKRYQVVTTLHDHDEVDNCGAIEDGNGFDPVQLLIWGAMYLYFLTDRILDLLDAVCIFTAQHIILLHGMARTNQPVCVTPGQRMQRLCYHGDLYSLRLNISKVTIATWLG